MARLALVTGTSTGIGRAIAIHLAQRGFGVLAGVRKPEDAPPGLEPIVLDVTSEDDIAAAAGRVGRTLHALVNNAGIAVNGPVEVVPVEEWRRQFEVNLIGQVAVTRARLARDGLPPEAVAGVVGDALTARRPRTRYVRPGQGAGGGRPPAAGPRVRRAGRPCAYSGR
jgi:NAD(P)-dependent dehydrogenase (short-subunit alcohol dehydrogenase family)